MRSGYQYVYVWGEGFHEPVGRDLANDSVEYGLDMVARSEALTWVATESRDASPGAREALETGRYRASDRLDDADELLAHDGSYYVVTATSYESHAGEPPEGATPLEWGVMVVGAGFALRGQRLRGRADT